MGTITGALGEATNYFRPKSHETANPTEENEPNPRRVINQPDEESRVKDDNHEGHKDSFAISNVSSAAQEEEGNPISSEMNAPSRTRTNNRRVSNDRYSRLQQEDELEKVKKGYRYYRKHYEDCQKEYDKLKRSYRAAKGTTTEQKLEIAKLTNTEAKQKLELNRLTDASAKQAHQITDLQETAAKQKLDVKRLTEDVAWQTNQIAELEATGAQQRYHITELTESISRSAQSVATTTRDDDFFEVEFARLSSDIHQWVFRYFDFRDVSEDLGAQNLPPQALKSLQKAIFNYNTLEAPKINRKEIEAVVVERLHSQIFRSNFIFMIYKMSYPDAYTILGGTDRERQQWHAQTVDMVTKRKGFNDRFRSGVQKVAKELQDCLDGLAKPNSQEPRHKALHAIVEHAAQLELETYRQVSYFRILPITPGSRFIPSLMEDRSGTVDDNEEEDEVKRAGGFIVQTVLFPIVERSEYDEAGKFIKPSIIVRKGTVIAIRGGAGHAKSS